MPPRRQTGHIYRNLGKNLLLLFLSLLQAPAVSARAQETPAPQLKIGGAVTNPLVLTPADLKAMPRETVKVLNTHNQKSELYEGVPLETLLLKAGRSSMGAHAQINYSGAAEVIFGK